MLRHYVPPLPDAPSVAQAVDGVTVSTIAASFGMAAWGCTVNYFYRLKRRAARFCLRELLIELFASTFAGVTVFILSVGLFHTPAVVAAAFSGLAGHAGARTIVLLFRALAKKADVIVPDDEACL